MSDTAVRRLAEALAENFPKGWLRGRFNSPAFEHAVLAEAIKLGLAWAAAEKAVGRHSDGPADLGVVPRLGGYGAYTIRDGDAIEEFGSTSTLALLALKDKIGGKAE